MGTNEVVLMMTQPIRISNSDGINPRTAVLPRFPAFYCTDFEEIKEFADKHDLEVVRIVYDDHFFGYGFLRDGMVIE